MFRKLRSRINYPNVVATLALFVAVGTGTAYAANTVFSTDIVDGEVKAADIGSGEVGSIDVKDNSINTFDVHSFLGADVIDGSLTGADIQDNTIGVNDIGTFGVGSDEVVNDSLLQSDIRAGAVTGDEVLDNSLTGTDINESTLNLPQTPTTATFASAGASTGGVGDTFTKIVGKTLPAGSWAIVATANTSHSGGGFAEIRDTVCELRNGTGFIGEAWDRRQTPGGGITHASLSMNGGAQVPAGGGEVSLWCRHQGGFGYLIGAQMMMIRLDGFS